MTKFPECFFQDRLKAFGHIVSHRPAGGHFEFRTCGIEGEQVSQMGSIALVGCGVKLEVDLIEPSDEIDG
jgi:hypothetical protein